MTVNQTSAGGVQSLSRGLQVLRTLVDEGKPLTGTEIARRFGLHQSSISRVLATLIDLGYVRKAANGRFVPDYGVLTFAPAIGKFPLVTRTRHHMEEIAADLPGYMVHLCLLWRGQMIYLVRATSGTETIEFWGSSFPLSVSSPGLRLLLDLPRARAKAILTDSRKRHGWPGQREHVPATETALLTKARKLLDHDVLILDEWHDSGHLGAAIPLKTDEDLPVALAITGSNKIDHATVRLWLHDARRRIEAALT